MSQIVLAFDVYGTLIDTAAVSGEIETRLPGRGAAFAAAWRQKTLEYTFRRAAMKAYRDFDGCTADALDYTCAAFGVDLTDARKASLLDAYQRLPAFRDVPGALERLHASGARLLAFTNGLAATVHALLQHAGLRARFEDIVSVDEIKSFKPDPVVYLHYASRACATCADCWLVSANPFDVIGARAAGMRAVWVRRDPAAPFDAWELEPTAVISDLSGLEEAVLSAAP